MARFLAQGSCALLTIATTTPPDPHSLPASSPHVPAPAQPEGSRAPHRSGTDSLPHPIAIADSGWEMAWWGSDEAAEAGGARVGGVSVDAGLRAEQVVRLGRAHTHPLALSRLLRSCWAGPARSR